VSYETSTDVVLESGQKIAYVASGTIDFVRPNKLFVSRQGLVADAELYFNGSTLNIHGKGINAYFSKELTGTVDDLIDEVRSETGLDAPGADFLRGDINAYLTANITGALHVGETMMGGVRVHHLAFRTKDVDWQMWVRAEGEPLPLRYIITSKWVAQGPQYILNFSDWKPGAAIDPARFEFTPPDGATKVDRIDTDALGQIAVKEEQPK
jgi:hypothetical protein